MKTSRYPAAGAVIGAVILTIIAALQPPAESQTASGGLGTIPPPASANAPTTTTQPPAPTTTGPTAAAPTTNSTTTAPTPAVLGTRTNPYPQGHQTYGHTLTAQTPAGPIDVGTAWMPGTYLRPIGPNCWLLEIWFTNQQIPDGWTADTALHSTTGNRVTPEATPCGPTPNDHYTDIGSRWYGWHPNAQVDYTFAHPDNAQWALAEIELHIPSVNGTITEFWGLAGVWPHPDYDPTEQ